MGKIISIIIIFIILSFQTLAQKNFSNAFRAGHRAAAFTNGLLDSNTVVAYGQVLDSTWNAWFIKMDTMGNVLLQKQYEMKEYPDFFVSDNNWPLIKTSDKGYAFLGITYFKRSDVLVKIKENGELDFIKYYSYDSTKITYNTPLSLVETKEGFRYYSYRIYQDIGARSALMSLDKKGNLLNEVLSSAYEMDVAYYRKNQDTMLLFGVDIINTFARAKVTFLDNNFNYLGKKTATFDYGEGIVYPKKTKTGWVYSSFKRYSKPAPIKQVHDYWLSGTDEKFNVIWHKKIGYTGKSNGIYNICDIGNDEFLVLMQDNSAKENIPNATYNGALIQKINGSGDFLWSRKDTIFSPIGRNQNQQVVAIPLPSGNIIVLGWAENFYTSISRQGVYAWIVKLSKDGCLLEPACGISATGESFDIQEFRAFPNPASSVFTVEWKVPNESTWQLYLRDYSGRVVQQSEVATGSLRHTFSVENLASGLYFYELRASSGIHIESGKVIIQQ